MRIQIQCFHPEPEWKAHIMEELDFLENGAIHFKCPECEHEVIMFLTQEVSQ